MTGDRLNLEQQKGWTPETHSSAPHAVRATLQNPVGASAGVSAHLCENHYGIPELSKKWGFSEDVIRRWFLEKPRPGVLRHFQRKRGKRQYVSLRISESAAEAVYLEKCGFERAGRIDS
jgi:hypothetical protein